MKGFSTRLRGRSLTVIVIAAVILSSFIGIFYLYYVPANKENVDRYAFLILENIKMAITEKNKDIKKVYLTSLDQQNALNPKKYENPQKNSPAPGNKNASVDSLVSTSGEASGILEHITDRTLYYKFYSPAQKTFSKTEIPAAEVVQPLFRAHRKELFAYYMLFSIDTGKAELIYKSRSLDIGNVANPDSLFISQAGLPVSGTRRMLLKDVNYQLFYLPVNLDGQRLMLCGLLKQSDLTSMQYEIPPSFIYPFAIALLLLVIILPSLKFYIMGPDEEVRFKDIVFFILSLFTGSCIITLVIIQVILLKDGEILAKNNLDTLTSRIDSAFNRDAYMAYKQLNDLDGMAATDKTISAGDIEKIKQEKYITETIVQKYFADHRDDTTLQIGFSRVAWTDTAGQQVMEGELKSTPVYPDIKDRRYFKAFAQNDLYRVPYQEDSLFRLEPVYNWVNGEFRTIVSKRSAVPGMYITSISTQMYSVYQNILPEGYGFCIVDENGLIQYSSDSARNLRENFMLQLSSSEPLAEAIVGHQNTYSGDASFYGNNYFMNVHPLRNIPFFLVTYYDKGYIVPLNMRILIFALSFCAITFAMYFLMAFFLLWMGYYNHAFLYPPFCYFKWMTPQRKYKATYLAGTFILIYYVFMLLFLITSQHFWDINKNYVVLIAMLGTPVNMLLLFYFLLKSSSTRRKKFVLAGYFVLSGFVYFITPTGTRNIGLPFMIFQLLFIILLYYGGLVLPRKLNIMNERYDAREANYIGSCAGFVMAMIMVFAILPAAIFTWYAHNQEIIQSVKKQQLYLAQNIESRARILWPGMKNLKDYYSSSDFDRALFSTGIYSNLDEKVSATNHFDSGAYTKNFDELYFTLSDKISIDYYKSGFYPALRDYSTDLRWRWNSYKTDSLIFYYTLAPNDVRYDNENTAARQILKINSTFPPRFVFLKANIKGSVLIVFVLLLLCVIYIHIRTVARKVFLSNYFAVFEKEGWPDGKDLLNSLAENRLIMQQKKEKILQVLKDDHRCSTLMCQDLNITQVKMINIIDVCSCWYAQIWSELSDSEKNILYNFARNGLLNYKNARDIYGLIKKGILTVNKEERHVCMFHVSFRVYILRYINTGQLSDLQKRFKVQSTWRSFQTPMLIILLLAAGFIFFTQQDVWQKMIALITGLSSSIPFLLNLFGRTAGGADTAKSGS